MEDNFRIQQKDSLLSKPICLIKFKKQLIVEWGDIWHAIDSSLTKEHHAYLRQQITPQLSISKNCHAGSIEISDFQPSHPSDEICVYFWPK